MPSDLSTAIREHLDRRPVRHLDPPSEAAVLAVLDKCDAMRAKTATVPGGVGGFIADEFEQTIADALGITR